MILSNATHIGKCQSNLCGRIRHRHFPFVVLGEQSLPLPLVLKQGGNLEARGEREETVGCSTEWGYRAGWGSTGGWCRAGGVQHDTISGDAGAKETSWLNAQTPIRGIGKKRVTHGTK